MANEKDEIVRRAKLEIDVQESERKLKKLNDQLKEVEKRISLVNRLGSRSFSSYSRSYQYELSKEFGVSRSELSSMGKREYNQFLSSELKKAKQTQSTIQSKIQSSELSNTKQLLDLERTRQKLIDSREQKTKRITKEYEKQASYKEKQLASEKKYLSEADKAYSQFVSERNARIRKEEAQNASSLERKSRESRRARQADLEYVFGERLDRVASGGVGGVVGGLFDPSLGTSATARVRNIVQSGALRQAGTSMLQRLASQAMWGIQGRVLSLGYNTFKSGAEASSKMEDWLSETQAIAGSTSGTMGQLAKSIYEVGSNSRFTTEELTRTTTVLAQAGYSADDVSKLLGSVNSLATATGTDLRTSVDLLTSSMSLWTSQTSDASKMVDALVVAVNSSKAEISSIQKGMQYAGAAASQMGLSFNETVAAMSAVTNAGLKTRSIMGTGLRAVLTELSNPSKKLQTELNKVGLTISDVNVRTQGFTNVMKSIVEAGFGAENAFRSMDRQAASFYLALKSQLDLNNQLLETMDRRGVAEQAEQVRMDTTIAQIGRLKNLWFEIFATLGTPVNSTFKEVIKAASDVSEGLASALRSFKEEAKDADSVIERTTAEMDSMKTSAQALSEELWKLSKLNIGEDANKAAKAHANLTDRFNNERKVIRGLSQDYKQLKQYMIDIAVGQENENVGFAQSRIRANLKKVQGFPEDLLSSLNRGDRVKNDLDFQRLYSSAGVTAQNNAFYGRDLYNKLAPKLQTMPTEQLQSLIYNFESGSAVRGSLERLLTWRQSIDKDISYISSSPTGENLRAELEKISNIASSTSEFMSGQKYKDISTRLKDWSGPSSQQDIDTILEMISSFRNDLKLLDEMAEKYPSSQQIQVQTSMAREKLFENIQTLETQITNVATKAMEDIEKDLKNQSQTNKQSVIDNFMKKLKSLIGASSSGKSWLDSIIEKLENTKADESLIEALKKLREQVLSGLLKSAEVAYKKILEDAKIKNKVPEAKQKYIEAQGTYNKGEIALANLNYIRSQIKEKEDQLKSLADNRNSEFKEYSDESFAALTSPIEEVKVQLQLNEKEAIAEANRYGVNGKTFWDQTNNSIGQGGVDFLQSINQQSAAYSLTLEGLNSVSSGLKTAFKSIATEGMSVSKAFRDMATSILESLANKAIDKGVDYMLVGIGSAFRAAGKAAGGGFVSSQGIRRFASGGGIQGRDSVPALLMPGEYVMKKSAVDMIGKETLDSLNTATSRVSDEKTSNVRESKSVKPVVTNVYVVSDAKEAGMTANDVLVTIGRDILQGGQTRQLIQQVVQGRY